MRNNKLVLSSKLRKQAGFTLVELAIVIVVIGLLLGGVIAGRDMIEAANIRAFITQEKNIEAGVNTFHGKYGGPPGDLRNTTASAFGLDSSTGLKGFGNGNGVLEPGGDTDTTKQAEETVVFWNHLAASGIYGGGNTAGTFGTDISGVSTAANLYVESKLNGSGYWVAYSSQGNNYLEATLITTLQSSLGTGPGMSKSQASRIDLKMDDGNAASGKVIGGGGTTLYNILSGCTDYVIPADSSLRECTLIIRL